MAATQGMSGYGTIFEFKASGTWHQAGEVGDIKLSGTSVDSIDLSHGQSPGKRKESIPGMVDEGEVSFPINYVPGAAAMVLLRTLIGSVVECRITYQNGFQDSFNCHITKISKEAPFGSKMSAEISWKITGEATYDAAEPTG